MKKNWGRKRYDAILEEIEAAGGWQEIEEESDVEGGDDWETEAAPEAFDELDEEEDPEEFDELDEEEDPEEFDELDEAEGSEEFDELDEEEDPEEFDELDEEEDPEEFDELDEEEDPEAFDELDEEEDSEEFDELDEAEDTAVIFAGSVVGSITQEIEAEVVEALAQESRQLDVEAIDSIYSQYAAEYDIEEEDELDYEYDDEEDEYEVYDEEDEDEKGGFPIFGFAAVMIGILIICIGCMLGFSIRAGYQEKEAQVAANYAQIGTHMESIDVIGGQGLEALKDAMVQESIAASESAAQASSEYQENNTVATVQVSMVMTSIQKDLKIKFTNKATGKLIANVPFQVTVKAPDGTVSTWKDDDMDGIISKKQLTGGKYTVSMVELNSTKYDKYLMTASDTATVKEEITYTKVDVSAEIKKEEEIDVKKEEQVVVEKPVESVNTDTVAWVESTKTYVGDSYKEISKFDIKAPVSPAYSSRVHAGGLSSLTETAADVFNWFLKGEYGILQTVLAAEITPSASPEASAEPESNAEATPSPSPEATPSPTPEASPSATPEATSSPTPEVTPSPTPEATPSPTPEASPSATPEATPSPTPEVTPSPTPEASPSATPEATPSPTPSASPSATPEATPSPTPSTSPSASPSPTPSTSPSASPSPTPSTSPSASPSPTPSTSPSASPSPTPTPAPTELKTKEGASVYVKEGDTYKIAMSTDYDKEGMKFYIKEEGYKYTGWNTIDGYLYYFDANGNAVTGEQVIKGAVYIFDSEGRLNNGSGVMGIDVSSHNGSIDWNAVANAGVDYVIIRCGYRGYGSGVLVEDSKFRTNINGALNAGLKVGVYFFSQAIDEVEAVEEASMVLNLISGYKITFPIFLDVEYANLAQTGRADGLDVATRTAVCRAFCQTITNGGYRAGIYANKSWMESFIDMSQLSNYKVWLAQYAKEPTYGGRYDMWQYSCTGSIAGISGSVDLNMSYLGY